MHHANVHPPLIALHQLHAKCANLRETCGGGLLQTCPHIELAMPQVCPLSERLPKGCTNTPGAGIRHYIPASGRFSTMPEDVPPPPHSWTTHAYVNMRRCGAKGSGYDRFAHRLEKGGESFVSPLPWSRFCRFGCVHHYSSTLVQNSTA